MGMPYDTSASFSRPSNRRTVVDAYGPLLAAQGSTRNMSCSPCRATTCTSRRTSKSTSPASMRPGKSSWVSRPIKCAPPLTMTETLPRSPRTFAGGRRPEEGSGGLPPEEPRSCGYDLAGGGHHRPRGASTTGDGEGEASGGGGRTGKSTKQRGKCSLNAENCGRRGSQSALTQWQFDGGNTPEAAELLRRGGEPTHCSRQAAWTYGRVFCGRGGHWGSGW